MPAFHTIAVPHEDIRQARLTLDIFAADLWNVVQGRAPLEYQDASTFFQKTYLTQGLQNLIRVVQRRLKGEGGDPVIQMQTPFGGGKTHALISLYHKSREWGNHTAVIVGTAYSGGERLWEILARQLGVDDVKFSRPTSPGSEALRRLLAQHQPLLILMDEVLQYLIKAAGVQVGETTLAAQTLAFFQDLYEAVTSLDRVALVVTLPSSQMEHYDETGARLFEQVQKIFGRVQIIYTPVQENEVSAVIRQRLFSHVDESKAQVVIRSYTGYAQREGILQSPEEAADYRQRFTQSFPFLPEVIDVLYHRWGSFPNFQRTRGVLRLLALVVQRALQTQAPYLTLADFDLSDQTIRQELLAHIGNNYESVISADITSSTAGARKADQVIGKAYQNLGLGKRVATTIFMYSHLGGSGERGATLNEIKRHAATLDMPSSIIAEVVDSLSNQLLFYLHEHNQRYFFSTKANLNRILTIRMENLSETELRAAEKEFLSKIIGPKIKTYLWPERSLDIPDTEEPKLIIVDSADEEQIKRFLFEKGQVPRVNRNTLIFLTPAENERPFFKQQLCRYLASESLASDKTLDLSAEERQELQKQAKHLADELKDHVRRLYRELYLPDSQGITALDLGMPLHGTSPKLDEDILTRLKDEGRMVEHIAPSVIQKRYLKDKPFLGTRQIMENSWRTPGEVLVVDRKVWADGIAEGVRLGLFGLGDLTPEGEPVCRYYKETAPVSFENGEVIIRADICEQQRRTLQRDTHPLAGQGETSFVPSIHEDADIAYTPSAVQSTLLSDSAKNTFPHPYYSTLRLRFRLPKGKLSDVINLLKALQGKFESMTFDLTFAQGEISDQDIDRLVRETFRQLGLDVEIETK